MEQKPTKPRGRPKGTTRAAGVKQRPDTNEESIAADGWKWRWDVEKVARKLGYETLLKMSEDDPKWFYEKIAIRLLPKVIDGGDTPLSVKIVHEVV